MPQQDSHSRLPRRNLCKRNLQLREWIGRPRRAGPPGLGISEAATLELERGADSLGAGTTSAPESSIFSVQDNFFGRSRRRTLPPVPLPAAFTFARIGYAAQNTPVSEYGVFGSIAPYELERASLKRHGESLGVGIAGIGATHPRMPVVPALQGRPPAATAFHRFFALSPPLAEQAPDQAEMLSDGLTGILERQSDTLAQLKLSAAIEAFRRATSTEAEQRIEAFWRAHELLESARELNPDSYVPPLLLVHTALAKRQLETAMNSLILAVRRNPNLFADEVDVAAFFGDSTLLAEQVRPYLRVGDDNPDLAAAWGLQAYCAWILRDSSRVETALDQMKQLAQRTLEDEGASTVRYALHAALR